MRSFQACILFMLVLLAGTVWAADLRPFPSPPVQGFETGSFNTVPAQGARAYVGWFRQCVDGLSQDMPNITASANAAAALFVNNNYSFGVYNSDSQIYGESMGRAGGIMAWNVVSIPTTNMVVLYSLTETNLDTDLSNVTQLHNAGNLVIILGNTAALQQAVTLNTKYDYAIDVHAAPNAGLFQMPNGTWQVNTDITAKITALWTWTAEFIGACTRLGKMPTMWESVMVTGGSARDNALSGLTFHNYTPVPMGVGVLGQQYLNEVWIDFNTVANNEMAKIHQAASLAVTAKHAGHNLYMYSAQHSTCPIVPCPHDTGLLVQMNNGWPSSGNTAFIPGITPQQGDFALLIGYDSSYNGDGNGDVVETLRADGTVIVHCFTDYNQTSLSIVNANEPFINEHWGYGDAVVYPTGYDIKICPTSGVIEHSIFWMVNAEILRLLTER